MDTAADDSPDAASNLVSACWFRWLLNSTFYFTSRTGNSVTYFFTNPADADSLGLDTFLTQLILEHKVDSWTYYWDSSSIKLAQLLYMIYGPASLYDIWENSNWNWNWLNWLYAGSSCLAELLLTTFQLLLRNRNQLPCLLTRELRLRNLLFWQTLLAMNDISIKHMCAVHIIYRNCE